jgi:hypothetical protein
MDLPEHQAAAESANAARDSLPAPRGNKTTARVEGGRVYESGWADTPGYEGKLDLRERVQIEGTEAGHDTTATAIDERGTPGSYESSHAERQAAIDNPDRPIGVSRDMCPACQEWFSKLAQSRGVPQFVSDPSGGRMFMPDGTVIPY